MKDVFEMTEDELCEKAGVTYRYIKSRLMVIKAKTMVEEAYCEMLQDAEKAMKPLLERFPSNSWEELAQAITQELNKKG